MAVVTTAPRLAARMMAARDHPRDAAAWRGDESPAECQAPFAATGPSDEELVPAAQIDPAAFAPLYERYADGIYRYFLRRLGNEHEAEDAASQTFVRAITALPRYRIGREGTFRSWLFTIAHNVAMDRFRRTRPTAPLDPAAESLLEDRSAVDPVHHALGNERRRQIERAMAGLTDRQREIIQLRLDGLNGPEIARVLGMSISATKSLHFRAYARLRELLEKDHA